MRAAIDGRRAARDLARLYGPPFVVYGDAPIAANDRGVSKAADQHNLKANGTTRVFPRNWRGRLPMPLTWYAVNIAEMAVFNGVGTAPCPLHPDRKRSLVVSLSGSRGTWHCSTCGHGDLIGFCMRRFNFDFVGAVRYLVLGVRP